MKKETLITCKGSAATAGELRRKFRAFNVFKKLFQAVCMALLVTWQLHANPLGTAFTYQGGLMDGGSPANGLYDLSFSLFDAGVDGSQVGPALTNLAVPVTNGVFSVGLDFGPGVFTGNALWLSISVQSNGSDSGFTPLSPLQPITSVPFALYADAGSAAGDLDIASNLTVGGIIAGDGSSISNIAAASIDTSSVSTNFQSAQPVFYGGITLATNADHPGNSSNTVLSIPPFQNIWWGRYGPLVDGVTLFWNPDHCEAPEWQLSSYQRIYMGFGTDLQHHSAFQMGGVGVPGCYIGAPFYFNHDWYPPGPGGPYGNSLLVELKAVAYPGRIATETTGGFRFESLDDSAANGQIAFYPNVTNERPTQFEAPGRWEVLIKTNGLAVADGLSVGGNAIFSRGIAVQSNMTVGGGISAGAINVNGAAWYSGAGSPEGVVAAGVGSLYTRTDGVPGATLYIKESGAGNIGWSAK